ncbi:metal-dependent hydrolase [Sutcliffiella horikoshii]|uniref:metal-dependent hydrolase n=1 Tax=Sutcliffiella horikoshii TaxID=79883 RepID=UPI001CFE2FE0|nr:metal-dependent hydrolase [Sutcliffiella horikoshii]
MDTGTHVVMGIALGSMATIDPFIASHPETATAIMLGTIIGSQAPDTDTILKFRNNATYIRNHRGITHSIPAVCLWPLLIAPAIYLFIPEANFLYLWIWTFIAVILHVFVDIFNAYGTQALRPFTKRWVALGIINTFDPVIFGFHIAGLVLWGAGFHPGYTFLAIYGILIAYYVLRYRMQQKVLQQVREIIPSVKQTLISPTLYWNQWHLAITTKDNFYVARAVKYQIFIHDTFEKVPLPENAIIEAAKFDDNVSAFLSFSPVYRWEMEEYDDHYEVRFIDLRYRSKDYYPFVAIVQLDHDLNIISSYTGWIFSEEKLRTKLEIIPNID